jgi:hypothetical protein
MIIQASIITRAPIAGGGGWLSATVLECTNREFWRRAYDIVAMSTEIPMPSSISFWRQ